MSDASHPSVSHSRSPSVIIGILFFCSGASALSAEVVMNRLLTCVFGSSHLATATVLAAYMSGLTAGAYFIGRYSARIRRPIYAYGLLELFVGLALVLMPSVFVIFAERVIALSTPFAGQPAILTMLRFTLSFLFVFVPTILMGGTLPVLVSAFDSATALGRNLSLLYAVNNLGAAAGTLLCAYVAIPKIGLDGTLYVASLINVSLALTALSLSRKITAPIASLHETHAAVQPLARTIDARTANMLAFSQGFIVFVLEVVWFHLIGTVIGVTTYAFAIMLSVILLGLGVGSLLTPLMTRRRGDPFGTFIAAQIVMAGGTAASLLLWDRFPSVIGFTLTLRAEWPFAAREIVRFLFVCVLLLPATVAMGVALPSLAAAVKTERSSGALVGSVFGTNTLGTIAGSIVCGFILLGRVDSQHILVAAVVLSLLLAVVAQRLGRETGAVSSPRFSPRFLGAAGACLVVAVLAPRWDIARLTSGCHYYWGPYHATNIVYCKEDAQSGYITIDRSPEGLQTLKTNGKYEGCDAPGEFQERFAFIASLYLKKFDRALLVGLGAGRTLNVMEAMPFKNIDAVEYSPAIIDAATTQFPYVKQATSDPQRVSIYCDDGRNFLQLSQSKYDLATVAISGAAFAGAGYIYSKDFVETVRSKLSDRGVMLLWIQIHHVFGEDVRSVLYTVRRVFPHVHFYASDDGSQGFIVASMAPLEIDWRIVTGLSERPAIQELLRPSGFTTLLDFLKQNIFCSEEELQRYFDDPGFAGRPVVFNDFYPGFEYSTPYGLATHISAYNFQPLSDKRLPVFNPPIFEHAAEALLSARFEAAGDYKGAKLHLVKAQQLLGKPVWQSAIEQLDRRIDEQAKQ